MKYTSISVDYKDPIKELQNELQKRGARNVYIKRQYNGEVEVKYTVKLPDPEKEISEVLTKSGAQNVRASYGFSGGRFEFKLDDIIDEREFKKNVTSILRSTGYRVW